jgi:hypothetical protein
MCSLFSWQHAISYLLENYETYVTRKLLQIAKGITKKIGGNLRSYWTLVGLENIDPEPKNPREILSFMLLPIGIFDFDSSNFFLFVKNSLNLFSYIMDFRKQHLEAFVKRYGVKMGFMSAFTKAAAYALQDQPVVNAVIEENVRN